MRSRSIKSSKAVHSVSPPCQDTESRNRSPRALLLALRPAIARRYYPSRLCVLPVSVLLLIALAHCSPSEKEQAVAKFVETRELMGTFATVTLIANSEETALSAAEKAFAALQDVSTRMNPRSEESEIYAVNEHAHERPVTVGETTFLVLQYAREHSRLSGGAFDVTVRPLIKLWKRCAAEGRVPDRGEIEESRHLVGFEKVSLDPDRRTIRLRAKGMSIDLGAIAKGFAIDRAVDAIRRAGVSEGIVEVGGDLRCFGMIPSGLIGKEAFIPVNAQRAKPGKQRGGNQKTGSISSILPSGLLRTDSVPSSISSVLPSGLLRTDSVPSEDRQPWPLGLQSPFGEELLGKMRIQEGAVATSGHYRRHVTIGGKRFSHIIDPRTGWPVELPVSVTVIADDAVTADALATAITVLGVDAGMAHADSLDGVEALILSGSAEQPEMYKTAGYPRIEPLNHSRQ
ncbi:MAG: FAD:protein FMN transferase [Candidatus Eisenbacteria sp.]|nr:FAD:protein FMN transferase [Candidatus Eisenbacteria bacterium]